MKIVKRDWPEINPLELQDGDIAIITQWYGGQGVAGKIIQCYWMYDNPDKRILILLGKPSGKSWTYGPDSNFDGCLVKVLPKGTTFQV